MFVCFDILILALASSQVSSAVSCDKTSRSETKMLVFLVLLCFAAEGWCYEEETSIIEPKSHRLCPVNEIYVKCRTICPPQFCNISYTEYTCGPETKKCEPGCDCIKNHLRDNNGKCILNDKCGRPPVHECPKNEVPSNCKQTCPPQDCSWDPTKMACKPGPCQPGCNCIEGYLRDRKGNCVPEKKCPSTKPQCGVNQVPSECADNYSAEPKITLCRPGCRCIEGHVRNTLDKCVPTKPQCGVNQVPSECADNYSAEPQITLCRPGCRCIEGYVRNTFDECVPILPQCGKFEEPTDCARNIGPYDSTLTIKCRPCQCIQGYVRDGNGVCVSQNELCKHDRNTTYMLCPNRCKSTCKNPNGICSQECREGYGCGCKPGYLTSDEGKCILPQDCPGGNPCGVNQTFVYCNAKCPSDKCPKNDRRELIACAPPNPCPSGCACKRNYRRLTAKDDKCFSTLECPPFPCTGKNEIYNPCPPACFSEGCGDKQPKICYTFAIHECQPQCVCKKNYRRNSLGVCIHISQCSPQCGINEEPTDCSYDIVQPFATDVVSESKIRCLPGCKCISGYQRDSNGVCVKTPQCGKYEEPTKCSYDIVQPFATDVVSESKIRCLPGCKCISGYQRDSNGVCVKTPQCGKYEEPTNCSYDNVQPFATDVVSESKIRCLPGCKCISGYQRDSNGVCVKTIQCGENEELSDCKKECPPDSCAWDPVLMDCRPVPCQRGCNCIKGYLRDDHGKCIPQQQCPQYQCGKYEEQTDCSDNYPQLHYAEDTSVGSLRIRCFPGCKCIAGFQRDSRGVCVRKPVKCPKDNEEWDSCPLPCFTDACGELDKETTACNSFVAPECKPRCMCRANYCRDSSGNCIPKEECPEQPILT